MKRSRCLLIRGVSEIGLRSFCRCRGGDTFGTGDIIADFQSVGICPSLMHELNIHVIAGEIICAQSLSTQFGRPSGPIAFFSSILDRRF